VVFRYVRPGYGAALTTLVAAALLAAAGTVGLLARGRAVERSA
jgi:hypothetical protein